MGDTCDVPEEELVDIGDFSLIDPGGDPSVLRAAADEWEARAGAIRGLSSRLGGRVSGLPRSAWDGDARDAFDGWWAQTADDLEQLATGFDEMAAQLRTVADGIEETNDVVHSIYIEIGATVAIGVAVSFISFGLGTAAAAARTAQLVARAMSWINKLKTLMRVVRASSAAFQTFKTTYLSGRIARFALRYGGLYSRALLINGTAGGIQRMVFQGAPHPFAGWSGTDVRNLLLGSAVGVGVSSRFTRGPFQVWTRFHPHLSRSTQGFISGSTTTVAIDALDGNLGWETLPRALFGGAFSAGTNGLLSRMGAGRPAQNRPYVPADDGLLTRPSGLVVPRPGGPDTVTVVQAGPGGAPTTVQVPVRPTLVTRPLEVARSPLPPGMTEGRTLPSGLVVPERTVLLPQGVTVDRPIVTPPTPPGFRNDSTPAVPVPQPNLIAMDLITQPAYSRLKDQLTSAQAPQAPQWQLPDLPTDFTPPPPPPSGP